jgi:glycosyltransferase involved in cell wall biosynthesis
MSTIAAIICTYNREQYIGKALESIKNQSLERARYQIVIVNNNSTDNSEQVCRDFMKANPDLDIILVNEPEQGLSAARNRGIQESDADYLTFVDDDATLDQGFLEAVTDYLDANPDVVAVGGRILLDFETRRPAWATHYLDSLFGYFNPGNQTKIFRAPLYPRGSNMSFSSAVFDLAGQFSRDLGRNKDVLKGNEEKELFARIYKLGKPVVYLPDAIVYHAVPAYRTEKDFIRRQAIGFGRSERIYRSLHGGLSKMYLTEGVKWAASLILFPFYLITLRPRKGFMILRFRSWVSHGMRKQA